MRDRFGRRCVKFIGVYKQTETTTVKAVYERVATEVPFADLLPDYRLNEQQKSRLKAMVEKAARDEVAGNEPC